MSEDFIKEFYCYKCSLQFGGRSVFNLHLKLLHKANEIKNEDNENESKTTNLAWKCTKCETDFERKESFDFHIVNW